jgi:hypothetical protein
MREWQCSSAPDNVAAGFVQGGCFVGHVDQRVDAGLEALICSVRPLPPCQQANIYPFDRSLWCLSEVYGLILCSIASPLSAFISINET